MLEYYDNLTEFAEHCLRTPRGHNAGEDPKWYGETFSNAVRKATTGDEALAHRIERYLKDFDIERDGKLLQHVVDGGAIDIGAFIAGRPDCFVRREKRRSERSPLNVYVNCTYGANFSPKVIERRGAAILALVQAVSELRPVELFAFTYVWARGDGWHAAKVKLESHPLSIAHAAYALCNASFLRQLGFRRGDVYGFNGDWPNDTSERGTRANLEIGENDIYIKQLDNYDPLAQNPDEWLQNTLTEILQEEDQ